jgi:hypothetical protein
MGKKVEMIGRRFGRWIVLRESEKRSNSGAIFYTCRCNCGTERDVSGVLLRNGDSTSCGCYNHETITKDDAVYQEKLYSVWMAMKNRCRNPNDKAYKNYGGRGISVCAEWQSDYRAFRAWAMANGYEDGLWIDRIDNDRDYCPENCQWITPRQQARNKRTNRMIRYNGHEMCITDAATKSGIPAATLQRRIDLGWSENELFRPVDARYSHSEAIRTALTNPRVEITITPLDGVNTGCEKQGGTK